MNAARGLAATLLLGGTVLLTSCTASQTATLAPVRAALPAGGPAGQQAISLPAASVLSRNTEGCRVYALLTATSAMANGASVQVGVIGDAAENSGVAVGHGNTVTVPAAVPLAGSLSWEAETGPPVYDHVGEVSLQLPIGQVQLARWGSTPNAHSETIATGQFAIPSWVDRLPPGKYEISGLDSGRGGECSGTVVLYLRGSLLETPAFWVGLALTVLALAWLLAVARGGVIRVRRLVIAVPGRQAWRAALGAAGGLLAGLFGAADLFLTGILTSGSVVLVVLPLVLLLAGLALGLTTPLARARTAEAAS